VHVRSLWEILFPKNSKKVLTPPAAAGMVRIFCDNKFRWLSITPQMHGFCNIDCMKPVEPKSRMHSNLINALILGILILVWIFVTIWFLVLRIFGEKRLESFLGLSTKARLLKRKSGTF
jgi:hypothetical protein